MNDEAYQLAVAAVALIVGLCLTWDGPQMWQAIFTLALSSLAALAACFEAQAWQLSFFSIATVMCQAIEKKKQNIFNLLRKNEV